ncbi:MAG: rhodanese-like domain-containing protein [gamma proteobacterium symbiont of Lucinoma myriamae]|nr:rhodanese-like domain-containing protein [gamma proteobacterium symbiont of Lucinoma myriamae]MCU7818500.1 rhodanese-like domain-containing protein [gamma proteobacterium symbiont of Lucinoma myriamae]MCU7832208.1 rhodanese-like domain-containing protein [gamma proteobacterium symbiont of Lucinoma myriamae]
MKNIIIIFLSFFLTLSLPSVHAESLDTTSDKLYPNRKFYPQLNYISTKEMVTAVKSGKYNVIDARPALGYKTLHIKEADNFSANDEKFNEKIMALINKNIKPIAFYCGGLACLKSYKASVKTIASSEKFMGSFWYG